MKTLKLALTFYRGFFFASLCLTLTCIALYKLFNVITFMLLVMFWFKIATYVLTFFHIKQAKRKEFYYYQALGVSKTTLWVISLLLDFTIFVIAMYAANQSHHA
ncbi:MAG: hypothetical protein V4580_13360 [Bacteroidota bacterium]